MIEIIIYIIVSYIFTNLAGWFIHWAIHQKWAGLFNRSHMAHHQTFYPENDLTSDIYRDAGSDSTPRYFIAIASPLIIIPIILAVLGIIPISFMIILLSMYGVMGYLNNYVHDSMHINNHILSRLPIISHFFEKWKKLHFAHHENMASNYGIFTFYFDRLFGTYSK